MWIQPQKSVPPFACSPSRSRVCLYVIVVLSIVIIAMSLGTLANDGKYWGRWPMRDGKDWDVGQWMMAMIGTLANA